MCAFSELFLHEIFKSCSQDKKPLIVNLKIGFFVIVLPDNSCVFKLFHTAKGNERKLNRKQITEKLLIET